MPVFVGGAVASKAGATSGNSTISLSSGLTGGIASAAQAGDFVIAGFATGAAADRTLAITDGTNNYTLIGSELYSNGTTYDSNLRVGYKLITNDTAVTFGPTGNAQDGGAMFVHVWRNVDTSTPLDGVTPTTATGTGTGKPDGPAITPNTAGAIIIVVGAQAAGTGANFTQSGSELSNFRTTNGVDTNDGTIGVGSYAWSSGSFNPVVWTGGSSNAANSWTALCFALRPGAAPASSLTAALDFVGVDAIQTRRAFTAALSWTGAFAKGLLFTRAFTAALSFAGNAAELFGKTFAGVLSFGSAANLTTIAWNSPTTPAQSQDVVTSTQTNDVLIAWVVSDSTGNTVTWPSGFTEIVNQATTTDSQKVCVAIKNTATGSEGTLNISSDQNILAGVIAVRGGADNASPQAFTVNVTNQNTGAVDRAITSGSVTPNKDGTLFLALFGIDVTAGFNCSATFSNTGTMGGWSNIVDVNSGFHNMVIGKSTQATAGEVTVTGTSSTGGNTAGGSLSIIGIRPGTTSSALSFRTGKAVAAALSFAGATRARMNKALDAVLSWVGDLATSFSGGGNEFTQALSGALSFAGTQTRATASTLSAAALAFAGAAVKQAVRPITGALGFTGGGLVKRTNKPFAGVASFAGAIARSTSKGLASILSWVGGLTGSLNGGAQQFNQALNAALSFTGAATKRTARSLSSSSLSFTGAVAKHTTTTRTAVLSFVGTTVKRSGKILSGVLSFAVAIRARAAKVLTATISFAGATTKRVARALTAALSWIGNLASQKIGGPTQYTQALSGALSFTATKVNRVYRAITATLSFAGAAAKRTVTARTAALSLAGSIVTLKSFNKALTATLSFVGTQSKRTSKSLIGGLSFVGSILRRTFHKMTAALTPIGVLLKRSTKAYTATLSFIGSTVTSRLKVWAMTATLAFTGAYKGRANKAMNGVITFSTAMKYRISKVLDTTLTFTTNITRYIVRVSMNSVLGFTGVMTAFVGYVTISVERTYRILAENRYYIVVVDGRVRIVSAEEREHLINNQDR